jgi:hypothetical protein
MARSGSPSGGTLGGKSSTAEIERQHFGVEEIHLAIGASKINLNRALWPAAVTGLKVRP